MNIKSIIKKVATMVFILVFSNGAFADGQTREFTVDGIRVIFKSVPKEVISVRLFIEGGTANYTKAQEGIESLSLRVAVDGGTKTRNAEMLSTQAEKIGAKFDDNSTYDYSTISMTCIKSFFDKSWELYADIILNPVWDAKEFEKIKDKMINAAKQSESNPDVHLRNIAMDNVFKGRNYSKRTEGTEESLNKLTLEATKNYYKNLIGKKKVFVVIVGNLTEEQIRSKVSETFGKLPPGMPPKYENRVLITKGAVRIEDRDIATNYLRGLMSAPTLNSPDGVPMRMAMDILRDRFFVELRTKRSLSYAPAAFYSTGVLKDPYNAVYISTTDPKQSLEVMVEIINGIKKAGFEEKELVNTKLSFLTHYLMGIETAAQQSYTLGNSQIAGDWRKAETFTEDVEKTALKDLNRVFDEYTNAIIWTYLGKKDQVAVSDFKQTIKTDRLKSPY